MALETCELNLNLNNNAIIDLALENSNIDMHVIF